MTTPTVTQAIAAVMQEMPAVGKDDRAPQGYTYRGIEAITRVLQPLCAKHGVVIVPSTELLNLVPSPSMKEGWQDLHVAVTWRIYGPAGDHLEATTYGVGRDNSDKGANKAHTQALKYLLLSLFLVADKADDADSIATPEPDQPARPSAPKAATRNDHLRRMGQLFAELGVDDKNERLDRVEAITGRTDLERAGDLTAAEARKVVQALENDLLDQDQARADLEDQRRSEAEQ